MSERPQQPPKTLFLSLIPPAAIRVDESDWDLSKRLSIGGTQVEGNDSPWCALVADLLIDDATREFVGMTFQVQSSDFEPANRLAQRLDSAVVNYDDISTESSRQRYGEEAGVVQRFEIIWAPRRHPEHELSQLLCGQWFWWYALPGEGVDWDRVVAFGISDVDDVLRDHKLTFPNVSHLQPLKVEWS